MLLFHFNRHLKHNKSKFFSAIFLPKGSGNALMKSFVKRINKIYSSFIMFFLEPDIVHLTFYSPNIKMVNSKCILTVYDSIRESEGRLDILNRNNALLNNVDGLIFISSTSRKEFSKYYNFEKIPSVVIPLGISDFFLNYKPSIPTNYATCKYFLYVGMRDGYKNFHLLCDAAISFKRNGEDIKVICVGGNKFNSSEIDYFRANDVMEIFYYMENPTDQLLADLYFNSLSLILTSESEGFGLPLIEALAIGTLVISSRAQALVEIGCAQVLYFNSGNSDELYERMKQVLNMSNSDRKNLVEGGRIHAKNYTWDLTAKLTLDFYSRIINDN